VENIALHHGSIKRFANVHHVMNVVKLGIAKKPPRFM